MQWAMNELCEGCLKSSLKQGRQKHANVMMHGLVDCGKTFLL